MNSQSLPRAGSACEHTHLQCVNAYELIRKYRCARCGAVMMCSCEETFAVRFLAHQLGTACELETQLRVPVTHGFQPCVCHDCRGMPPLLAPKAELYRRGSKIHRYYWREIYFETTTRLAEWAEVNCVEWSAAKFGAQWEGERKRIERAVVVEIQRRHEVAPKYFWNELSDAEILRKHSVEIVRFDAEFAEPRDGHRSRVRDGMEWISAEEFVRRQYEQQGFSAITLESRPLHVLFAVYMWLLIQDQADMGNRLAGFGSRNISATDKQEGVIWTWKPYDFGTPGYARRRKDAIDKHLGPEMLDRSHLEWLFDYWLPHSEPFREYLHAYRQEDVERARRLVEILPPAVIIRILRYLVEDYWGRYLGWPDLFVFRDGEFCLVEVKARSDDLSGAQKRWIEGNATELCLPFKLAKIHKRAERES